MQHPRRFNVIGDMKKVQFLPISFWPLACLALWLMACHSNRGLLAQEATTSSNTNTPQYIFPYRMGQPDAIFKLPKKLVEVSGLSLTKDGSRLVLIQDEDGIVFFMDKKSGEIVEEIKFGKEGDYEGVEIVGEDIYIVKSSSKIYKIKKYNQALQEVFKFSTPLTKEHDIEGLAYDTKSKSLLLACKGQPDLDNDKEKSLFVKAIYRFSLESNELDTIPALSIDRQDVIDYFKEHPPLIKVNKDGEIKESNPEKLPCYPSAIAIHPVTGNYYITSSKGKVLFIVSPQGEIIHLEKLDKRLHPQPEGLVFDSDGTLYLSNEGKDGPGRIYRFASQIGKNQ